MDDRILVCVVEKPYLFKPFTFSEVKVYKESVYPAKKPDPRSGHRIVCDDGNLYSFGGYLKTQSQEHRLFEELWCFNFAERRWKFLSTTGTAHKELASHCTFLYGNFLHAFGGTGINFGESTTNTLSTCDLRVLKWAEVKTIGDPPPPQYGQALIMDDPNKCFYVIGGTTGFTFSMDIHKFNLTDKSWEVVYISKGDLAEPVPRYRHEVALYNGMIYVFGGGTSNMAYTLKIVAGFNLKTRKWSKCKTERSELGSATYPDSGYPRRRKCHASVQIGEDVYICGGCNATVVYNDIWRFNIPTRKWHCLPISMPLPLSFHTASVTAAGCMYIFGGVTDIARGKRTNKVFKIWLKIPKLTEICWEAILESNERIKKSTREDLLNLGIPSEFVTRVHPSPPEGTPDKSVQPIWESDFFSDSQSESYPSAQHCLSSFI